MDEGLIELVREYEELYDMSNKKYSDNLHKDNIWKLIGEKINKPGECARCLLLYLHSQGSAPAGLLKNALKFSLASNAAW